MRRLGWLRRLRLLLVAPALLLLATTLASADSGADHQTTQTPPISLGTSGGNINDISKAFCYGGTLGALVSQTDGTQYILSNNHVLARLNRATSGEDIIQPGLIDVSCRGNRANTVADLSAFVTILFKSKRTMPTNTVDAAIALVRGGQVQTDGRILDIGTISGVTAQDQVGCAVEKSGRTTGLTTGTITAVDVTVDINYGNGKFARFTDQFLIGSGSFSAAGDSGSLVVTVPPAGGTPSAVGLLFAGSSSSTIANPIGSVLSLLGVQMVGSGTGTDCPEPSPALAAATAAKGRHEQALLHIPDVAGVGVGRGGAIEVYLARDNAQSRARIPAQLDGVPVRVVVTGEFQAR